MSKINMTQSNKQNHSVEASPQGENNRSADVPQMFDRISKRYDRLNQLLSFNLDRGWRKKVAALLPDRQEQRVLDLACGTGDQLLALHEGGRVSAGVGIDLAEKMLAIGQEKITKADLQDHLNLQTGDAQQIPFDDGSFDAVTIAFGIRNVSDVPLALSEMYRVLNEGGRAIVLEFSMPSNSLIKALHLFYLRYTLPAIGRVISGDSMAYRYLDRTIEAFPYGDAFCELLRQAGFRNVQCHPVTFGSASIYTGDK